MIKLLIFGRCAADKTRAAALSHMRAVHGPMVYDPPADAGAMPTTYGQNHALEDGDALPARWRGDCDFVTEIGFDKIADLKAATSTPYFLTQLRPDESNFVNQATVRAIPTRLEGISGTEGFEPVRLFLFLKLKAPYIAQALDEQASAAAVTARASHVALPSPDGRPAPFDRVERLSFASRAAAVDFVQSRFAALAEMLAPLVETPGSFALLADHYSVARLRAVNAQASAPA